MKNIEKKQGSQQIERLKADLGNRTIVGEYIGNQKFQHLIKYSRKTLIFYSVVENNSQSQEVCWLPMKAQELFKKYDLDTVKMESLGHFSSYDKMCDTLASCY